MGLRRVTYIDAHLDDAGDGLDRLTHVAHQRGVIGRSQQQSQSHFAVGRGRDIAHHFGAQDIGAGTRVSDGTEGDGDLFLKRRHRGKVDDRHAPRHRDPPCNDSVVVGRHFDVMVALSSAPNATVGRHDRCAASRHAPLHG